MNSDMKIAGSGKILAGEYNKVILKGKVHHCGKRKNNSRQANEYRKH